MEQVVENRPEDEGFSFEIMTDNDNTVIEEAIMTVKYSNI